MRSSKIPGSDSNARELRSSRVQVKETDVHDERFSKKPAGPDIDTADLRCTKTTDPDTDMIDFRESEIFDHLGDNE